MHVLAALALAILGVGGCSAPVATPERIVLVTIDTLRPDHLGCYGAADAHTPNLDTLAAQGVRFEVALSPAPLTLPAHASLMTGLDPPAHGVRHNSIHRLGAGAVTLAERLSAAGYATGAVVGSLVLDRRFGLARGFDAYDDRMDPRRSGVVGFAERTADRVVDAALDWLADAPDRFFLWVHFYDPHRGYDPPPGFASAFASRPYDGEIAFTDAELGRLLGALRERWGDDGLLLVVTSDHGESLGAHGEPSHSHRIYEVTQRIPLLLRGPGLPEGRIAPGPAALVDIAPTILALAGAEPLPGARGRDLRTLLDAPDPGRSVYMETLATWFDYGMSPLLGVRSGSAKYVRAPTPELYDLASDPDERVNLASGDPEQVARLDRVLAQHLAVPGAAAEAVELGAEDRERLRSLGYVVPEQVVGAVPLEEMQGPDPKLGLSLMRDVSRAQRALDDRRAADALAILRPLGDSASIVRSLRAAAALSLGEAAEAERDARALLDAVPSRTDMRMLLARALLAQGREAEADTLLVALAPGATAAPWAALRAARADARDGRRERALRRLEIARSRHPESPALAGLPEALLDGEGAGIDSQARTRSRVD